MTAAWIVVIVLTICVGFLNFFHQKFTRDTDDLIDALKLEITNLEAQIETRGQIIDLLNQEVEAYKQKEANYKRFIESSEKYIEFLKGYVEFLKPKGQ